MLLTFWGLRRAATALFVLIAAIALSNGALAAATPQPPARPKLTLNIQKATLENGLRVVLNLDSSSPNVAICVTYDVGARNEVPGRSGFAHLFEHMMFQGSENVAKGEHFTLVTARGGTLNGTTSSDRTNYFEVLPSSELALGLWLEADRMKSLAVTEENMKNQRAVVQEEYRMRVSNNAYMEGYMRLSDLVFEGYWPYAHDPIGSMKDLDAARFEWVREFHDSYYAPNNAVLTVAGDFEPDEAMRLIRAYFGDAKAQPAIPRYAPGELPEQSAPRVARIEDRNAKTKGVYYGWAIPPSRTADHYALEMAGIVLGDGDSSRLYQDLVRRSAKARSVNWWTGDHRGPDQLALQILLTERAKFDEVERIVERQIQALAAKGPSPAEMQKARNRVIAHFIFSLQTNRARAIQLGSFEVFHGDARLLEREVDRYLAVTPEQLREALARYATSERRSSVYMYPPGELPPATAPTESTGATR